MCVCACVCVSQEKDVEKTILIIGLKYLKLNNIFVSFSFYISSFNMKIKIKVLSSKVNINNIYINALARLTPPHPASEIALFYSILNRGVQPPPKKKGVLDMMQLHLIIRLQI